MPELSLSYVRKTFCQSVMYFQTPVNSLKFTPALFSLSNMAEAKGHGSAGTGQRCTHNSAGWAPPGPAQSSASRSPGAVVQPALHQPGGPEAAVKRDVQAEHPGRSTIRMVYTEGCSSKAGHARSREGTGVQRGSRSPPQPSRLRSGSWSCPSIPQRIRVPKGELLRGLGQGGLFQ